MRPYPFASSMVLAGLLLAGCSDDSASTAATGTTSGASGGNGGSTSVANGGSGAGSAQGGSGGNGGGGGMAPACVQPTAPDSAMDALMQQAWALYLPKLKASQQAALSGAEPNPYVNYNTQIFTASMLMFAEYQRREPLLIELAELYNGAFDYAAQQSSAVFYYAEDGNGVVQYRQELPLPAPAWMWTYKPEAGETVGLESILSSSQFLYATTRLSRVVSDIGDPAAPSLKDFAARVLPVALDHYKRWIKRDTGYAGHFQVRGWACDAGTRDHSERLQKLLDKSFGSLQPKSYCNAVTDTDMWIVAGALELLIAADQQPSLISLDVATRDLLEAHVRLGLSVFESRMTPATALDLTDSAIDTVNFELGTWDDHPGYNYAGYAGATYPGWTDENNPVAALPPMPATDVGWDISHARRLVRVFDTFYRFGNTVGSTFPDRDMMVKLARQFTFGTWNRDDANPLFSNFMDGTNGWYRVNYSNRPGFGYPPHGLTSASLDGGYGLWSYLEPELHPLLLTAHANKTYDVSETTGQAALVMTLPSIAPYSLDDLWCDWAQP